MFARLILIVILIASLLSCACVAVPEQTDNGATCDGGAEQTPLPVPPPVTVCSAARPHEDGVCFALAFGVYPQAYALCAQDHELYPVPFVCLESPPIDSCVPFYGDGSGWYPDHYCCCDPQRSAACDFYKAATICGD